MLQVVLLACFFLFGSSRGDGHFSLAHILPGGQRRQIAAKSEIYRGRDCP